MRIRAPEFLSIRGRIRVWCAIGITFQGYGRHGDDRKLRKPSFEIVILRLALNQAQPPAVIIDHDAHVIGVVEGRGAASERSVAEAPLGRRELPNELRAVVPVLVVAGATAFR